jgi:hypothetical protein
VPPSSPASPPLDPPSGEPDDDPLLLPLPLPLLPLLLPLPLPLPDPELLPDASGDELVVLDPHANAKVPVRATATRPNDLLGDIRFSSSARTGPLRGSPRSSLSLRRAWRAS